MKISYNWLKQYIHVDLPPEKVAELLTGCGLEVENLELYESVKGGLKGVVIGEVLTCGKHTNSDHLTLTTVNIGQPEPLKIVCGAPNVAPGQKVAVATIGTTLYFKDKELTLQRTKIRGEVSEGMICAEDELGLGTSHAGILILDPSAVIGTPAKEYFGIEEDHVFTIGLTPNRTDAMSHIGVARDLAAVLNNYGSDSASLSAGYKLVVPDVSSFRIDRTDHTIGIIVEDALACPRYSGLTMTGITVKESPSWLKNRLSAIGLRPINNIVDITNFIQMELGQPLHAFDGDKITGGKVIVKKHPESTPFITLDEVERKLTGNDLMICNAGEPMCIAGVFGGIRSGVTQDTKTVFLESACFDPVHIRKTSRHHGLQTDASFRFERGADIHITVYALKRAALLIRELAGGEVASEIIDSYPEPVEKRAITLSFANLDNLIGKHIGPDVVKSIITDLGMEVKDHDAEKLRVLIPGFKADVTRECDLIEEVLRIYGYNNIGISAELRSSLSYSKKPDPEKLRNIVSDYLAANGFYEVMNNSLSKSAYYEKNIQYPLESAVRILNPLSRDLDAIRQTLLYGGLETIVYNQNRKIHDLKLFEFGTVSARAVGSSNDPLPGFHEEWHLGLFLTGRREMENWDSSESKADFSDLKGVTEGILNRIGTGSWQFSVKPVSSEIISEGLAYLKEGKTIVTLGTIRESVLKSFDCKQPVLYAEWNWDNLLTLLTAKEIQFREINKFPEVRRDLALLLDKSVTFEEIERVAYETERRLIRNTGLFDVYEGKNIEEGKKSYAVNFILQDETKTLTDEEIEKTMEKLIKAFTTKLNAQIR
ncbi:MAG: phenylalanine--tRNA ligase subunit beta [bacterium]